MEFACTDDTVDAIERYEGWRKGVQNGMIKQGMWSCNLKMDTVIEDYALKATQVMWPNTV